MKTINMGLNTEPDFLKADEIIKRFEKDGNTEMIKSWENAKAETAALRDEIIETVEKDGVCELNWSCTGAARFTMHANQWAKALPQYDFTIGRYECIVRKLVPMPGAEKLSDYYRYEGN